MLLFKNQAQPTHLYASKLSHQKGYTQMANSTAEQLIVFEQSIGKLARTYISSMIEKTPVKADIKTQLANQLMMQAIERSREMLGPALAWVRAKKLSYNEAERALTDYGLPAIMKHWQDFLCARCEAVSYQLADVCRLLPEPISELQVLDGDTHNGARQPLKLTTNSNSGQCEYLYKSIDATPMRVVHRIAKALSDRLGIENFVDDVIIFTDHSYLRKFSSVSKPESQKEIEQYYYAFGAIVSVASALEISDLHFENLIATRNGPKIIDIEFILSNTQYQNTKWSYKNSGLFEPETSPIGQTYSHQHISPTYRLIGDNFQYSHLEGKRSDLHVLYDDAGKPLKTLDFAKKIGEGARDADKLLKNGHIQLDSILRELELRNHKIRCWIRGTAYYRILQVQLWLPGKSLKDQIAFMRTKLEKSMQLARKFPQVPNTCS